ncbi:BAHD acyltransferase At5g47980 [Manihot esculenta]|nr:BAHD acyltransferase At5g47980 [Manihot esculenta]KAG8640040.1 hypothetical protein MANES_13G014000v8 [Manihot esculenta]
MEINVKIVKKEIIKPSSPTLDYLRNFKLSLLDQFSPAAYASMLLFYSVNGTADQDFDVFERSQQLKRSLSETLTRFYPLAGRIKDNAIIECNDEGALFVEARVDCLLSKFLEKPNNQLTRKLIPVDIVGFSEEHKGSVLLLVQASFFSCGGLAIGVSISHKIADASTVNTFIKGWAAAAHEAADEQKQLPLLYASSIFPPQNLPFHRMSTVKLNEDKCITERYVIEASKIAALKTKAGSESVRDPTKVEAVTAFIWKCAMKASRSNSKQCRPSALAQSVNLRKRMEPPLPENTIGNLMGHFASRATESSEIDLASLVVQMRKGMQDFGENYVKKLQGDNPLVAITEALREFGSLLHAGNDTDFYIFTSLCRFPFYGIDFGWGKPIWVSSPRDAFKNIVALIDSRDGDGIEAWVTLTEEDMAFFEGDEELLEVAALNPSVMH